jgi:hypothetical protein
MGSRNTFAPAGIDFGCCAQVGTKAKKIITQAKPKAMLIRFANILPP